MSYHPPRMNFPSPNPGQPPPAAAPPPPPPPFPAPTPAGFVAALPRVFARLLMGATLVSILSTLAFAGFYFSRQTPALFTAGTIGLWLAVTLQMLGGAALFILWIIGPGRAKKFWELIVLLVSMAPFGFLFAIAIILIVYYFARRKATLAHRAELTRDLKVDLKEQAVNIPLDLASNTTQNAATSLRSAARPTIKDAARQVLGPTASQAIEPFSNSRLLATLTALALCTVIAAAIVLPKGGFGVLGSSRKSIYPSGTIKDFSLKSYIPDGVSSGPDGNLWFTEDSPSGGTAIGYSTPSGTIKQFNLPRVGYYPTGSIAAGPDKNLWFTSLDSISFTVGISRITPSGAIKNIPTSESASSYGNIHPVCGVTAGSDGNVWFTEQYRDAIGRVTPSGALKEFSLHSAGAFPYGNAAGPDGALWFTNKGYIGRITPSGAVTEFKVSGGDTQCITAGPDGAMWFTDINNGAIGRITTSGAVSEFKGSAGNEIASGPDGNLWFTGGDALGRITPQGKVTMFPLPISGVTVQGITNGPDGNLWYTYSDDNFGGSNNGVGLIAP